MLDKFIEIFQGLDIAYGEYFLEGSRDNKTGKEKGRAITKRAPVTKELFQKHLNGEINLGVIPIRQDNSCFWGCIDVDKYDLDHKALIKKIRDRDYPLVPYRSKSGGIHLFLHVLTPTPAELMIEKLSLLATDLGLSSCEIFPKQRQIMVYKNDLGNWLNIPYQQAARSTRYAMYDSGMGVPITQWYDWVQNFRLTPEKFNELKVYDNDIAEKGFDQYPPCLQALIRNGCEGGYRNNALTAFATLAKKKNPDGWQKEVWDRNDSFNEPLPSHEVQGLIKQYEKKDYQYKCSDLPMKNHCNAELCKTLDFGIDSAAYVPKVDSFQRLKTSPPIYFLTIEKKTVELTGKACNQQQLFAEALFDQADIVWQKLKDKDFRIFLMQLKSMQQDVEGYDEDTEAQEEFKDMMIQFTQETQQADNASQIEADMWYLFDDKIVFKYKTFERFIRKSNKTIKKFELINFLKKNGAVKKEYYDKIKIKNVWYCKKFIEPVIERSNNLFKRKSAEFDDNVKTKNN